jgi:hypothetical protein
MRSLEIRFNVIDAHRLSTLLGPSLTCRERRNKERKNKIRNREISNEDRKKEEESEKKTVAVFLS